MKSVIINIIIPLLFMIIGIIISIKFDHNIIISTIGTGIAVFSYVVLMCNIISDIVKGIINSIKK